MKNSLRSIVSALASAALLAGCASRPQVPLELNIVSLNDFHGYLEGGRFSYTAAGTTQPQTLHAGGISTIAAALQAWRQEDRQLMFVGAGDLIGASPAISSMWADEPTLTAMGMLGMRVSATGNHEFDVGRAELLRQQHGGCASVRPEVACKFTPDYRGASFAYVAANVVDADTGKTLLPAYRIEQAHGVKVAFIGAVIRNTPAMVLASGVTGLDFRDEADSINRAMAGARADGATVFVALVHEGGHTEEAIDQPDCSKLTGPIVGIARRLDPAIRLVVSGHTHKGFQCKVDERVVTQAEVGGHVLSRIKLLLDPATHAVRDIRVRNVVMKPGTWPADPAVDAYLKLVKARSDAALARPVAKVAISPLSRKSSSAGESALGNLVADAMLEATRAEGVQIAFMNQGGIRRDLDTGAGLTASYGQTQVVLPYANTLVVMDLTGRQLRQVLEQQWLRTNEDFDRQMLQVSRGFSYQWSAARPKGERVVPGSIRLDGVPLSDTQVYRVAVNNFLAEGGDNFPLFRDGRNVRDTHILDLDSFIAYLARNERAGTPAGSNRPAGRVEKVD
ncbi:MAG: bifunctional metallophosphatase/5'-nucleotidase [Pseudomonadota bacterium]